MFATNHAQGLYRGIEKYGGGSIRELTLRCEAGNISHGTFIAARQELCELGLIAIERIARKPHYELINPVLAEAALRAHQPGAGGSHHHQVGGHLRGRAGSRLEREAGGEGVEAGEGPHKIR